MRRSTRRCEQKVIDAVEAQLPAGYGSKLYEVTKFVTKTGHINLITGLVTSAHLVRRPAAELQTMLREEALKAGDMAPTAPRDSLATIESNLKAAGVTVNEIDITPFQEATAGVYEKLGYGELREQLQPDRRVELTRQSHQAGMLPVAPAFGRRISC